MHLDEIDGELHILDENLNIIHVFERARSSDANGEVTLSRAARFRRCLSDGCAQHDPDVRTRGQERYDIQWNYKPGVPSSSFNLGRS